jgi:DNA-directed RNA polymerase specialized sigma24 family protein
LYGTARRVIANKRRSSRRRVALQDRLALEAAARPQEPPSPDPQETIAHAALRRLGPRDREVLLLAEWEGLSPTQIAAVLDCLTVTARGRLHRARRRFRAAFEDLLAGEDSEHPRREPAVRPRTTTQISEGGT